MVLEKIKEKIKLPQKIKPSEEWVELGETLGEGQKVPVRIETLNSFSDTNHVLDKLREGSVVFLRIKDLRGRDVSELKRSVEKLKKTCNAMNGDMIGVDEDFIILTPSFAKVWRGQ